MKKIQQLTMHILLIFVLNASTNGQTLFNYLGGGLNTSQATKMNNVVANNTNIYSVVISVNDIFTTTVNDSLQINLKNPNLTYSISPTSIKATSVSNYVWYGEFNNEDNGYMMLIKEGDDVYGTVSVNGNNYSIEALGNGKSVISKKTPSNPAFSCSVNDTTSSTITANTNSVCANSSVAKVLILYTSTANTATANINQRANSCIQQVKTVLNNSKLSPTQVDVVAATPTPIFYNVNYQSASTTILNTFAADANVQNLRNLYNADMVVLLFKLTGTGGTYGIANVNSNVNNAYFMVDVDDAINPDALTFSHELGHLYGGRHEYTCLSGNTQCDNTDDQYHAFIGSYRKNFWSPYIKVKTTMYSGDPGTDASKIMYYSNPDVNYVKKKFSLGSVERENVAKKIRDRAYEVGAFRPDGYLVASINGASTFDPGYTYNWNAIVNCGIQPYTYEWRTSTNGATYSVPVSTTSTFSYTMPNIPALYLWLRVTSADGQVVNDYKRVTNRAYLRETEERIINNVLSENEANPFIKIYPNPATNYTILQFYILEQGKVWLTLYNQNGEKVKELNYGLLEKGNYVRKIDLLGLETGIYSYRLSLNGKFTNGKIIVNTK